MSGKTGRREDGRTGEQPDSIYDFTVTAIDGTRTAMAAYRDRTLLIVNVASQCGFTPQYRGLEALHRRYEDRGLSVLGFPCDQFGHQEPGDEEAIRQFCTLHYEVTFPLFAKIKVNGPDADPLYQFLKAERKGLLGSASIKWNFTKFLVQRNGRVLKRYAPKDAPEKLEAEVAAELG